jgi:hypothetical protein
MLVLLAMLALLAGARPARADEVAPELEALELREGARAELTKLVAGLTPEDKKRLVGVYVAFDPTPSDALAQVACDDDGDYVVVLSDGLLRLAHAVARAQADDEERGTHRVDEYAAFLAASQVPGRRLLPPPAGSYEGSPASSSAGLREERLAEALSFVVARELAHLRAADLVCPRPSATREHGDDVWTAAEQRAASEAARALYPNPRTRPAERDAEAVRRVRAAGHETAGAVAWLRFVARLEDAARFRASYVVTHPQAAARIAALEALPKG